MSRLPSLICVTQITKIFCCAFLNMRQQTFSDGERGALPPHRLPPTCSKSASQSPVLTSEELPGSGEVTHDSAAWDDECLNSSGELFGGHAIMQCNFLLIYIFSVFLPVL